MRGANAGFGAHEISGCLPGDSSTRTGTLAEVERRPKEAEKLSKCGLGIAGKLSSLSGGVGKAEQVS
jgi:hypothetical protein